MKIANYLIYFFVCIGFSISSFAQNNDCNCSTDVAYLHKKLKKTPAYKRNATNYKYMYPKVLAESKSINNDFDCLVLLNKLTLTLNDNHIKINGAKSDINPNDLKDVSKLDEIKKTTAFSAFPRPKIDLDSLEKRLKLKPLNELEGVYYRKNYVTIGCFYDETKKMYHSIILDSESPLWERGELMYTMIPYGNDFLRVIGGNLTDKRLISYTERIYKGTFLTMRFQKDSAQKNHSFAIHPKTKFKRVELNEAITYLKIGSFKSFDPILPQAEKFYKTLENTLTKKYVIIDLRDNTGGGDRNSNVFLKIIKKYILNHTVIVLVNHRTGSNAEQFAYKLSAYENCTILGDQTQGTAAYEIKNSVYQSPCRNYKAVLTSKKHLKFIDIESKGIQPKVKLSHDSPWLDQILIYINKL